MKLLFPCQLLQVLGFALPNCDDRPANVSQSPSYGLVALDISSKFPLPECFVRLGTVRIFAAGVSMPITAMYKYGRLILPQYDIGDAG